MTNDKTCMVTGDRNLPPEKADYIREQLEREIMAAIADGYTHFISGLAHKLDFTFADIIVVLKQSYPITLEAAIPYRNRINTEDSDFQRLFAACNIVGIHSEVYNPACFTKRNRIMVQLSHRVIAVYDGREKGNTFDTMRYAHVMEKEIHIITIK